MREVRRAIQRIYIPAIIAALIAKSLLFTQNVVRGPLLADAVADQHFGSPVGRRYQVSVALVFDLQVLLRERCPTWQEESCRWS